MRRRGVAAVMAMIFLVLFGALAVAFYAMASTSVQVSKNDRNAQQAMAAAESGMAFVQRQIADLVLQESEKTGTEVLAKISAHLKDKLNGKLTMQNQSIPNIDYLTETGEIGETGDAVQAIPWITPHLNSTQRFQARIRLRNDDSTKTRPPLELTVIGEETRYSVRQTLRVNLHPVDRYMRIFTFGLASKGRVDLADEKASIFGDPPGSGSIVSTYVGGGPAGPAVTLHGGTISGDVFVVTDPSTAFYTDTDAGSIGGAAIDPSVDGSLENALTHVQQISAPEFPEFTPNIYDIAGLSNRPLPKGEHETNPNHFQNIRITSDMEFGGNDVLEGIIYVKAGVNVTFAGNPTIRGTIVVEDSGNPSVISKITFKGVPVYQDPVYPPVAGLDSTVEQGLRGYSFLGPTAYVYLTGNVQANDDPANPDKVKPNPENAEFARTIVCSTLEEYGSGVVKIRDGALITLSDTMMTGKQGYSGYFDGDGVRIVRTAGYTIPFGAYVHKYSYLMDVTTYEEN